VQLGATSQIKGDSDLRKFEKARFLCVQRGGDQISHSFLQARELKKRVESIREDYKKGMKSKDDTEVHKVALKRLPFI